MLPTLKDTPEFGVRYGTDEDTAFVYDSWLKSYRQSPDACRMTRDVYMRTQKRIIAECLSRGTLIVACNPTDRRQIYGYSCVEYTRIGFVFHWIFVKYPFRKLGFARELIELLIQNAPADLPLLASHISFPGFFEHVGPKYKITYDPSLKEGHHEREHANAKH